MSAALVALGAPVQSTSGGAVTGLAYGQPPSAGNRLACWITVEGVTTTPATPAGWFALPGRNASTLMQAKMFSKIAAGNDAVPTFGAITSGIQTVMLGEFSGNDGSATNEQNFSAVPGSLTSPQTATATVADAQPGELILYIGGVVHSVGVTDTASITVNGVAGNDTNNNASSTVNHYVFGWSVASSNASPDTVTLNFSTTSVSTWVISANSFRLAASQAPRPVQLPRSLGPAAVGPTFFAPTAQQQPPTGLLLAWYAADQIDLAGVGIAAGTPISSWPDLTSNAFAAVQATPASQPIFLPNSLNGLPTVFFGGAQLLNAPGVPQAQIAQPVTTFAVVKDAAPGGNRYLGSTDGSWRAGTTNFAGTALTPVPGFVIGGPWNLVTSVFAGTSSVIRFNGAVSASGTVGTASPGSAGVQIGASGAQFWIGPIAEIILYRGVLSPAQILAVESYLNQKWFTAPALPSKISLLPRTAGPEAVGPTFFAALYVPWTPPPLAQPVMSPTESAITAAVIALTAASSMVVTAQGVTASTVSLTAASQIAVAAQSVSTAAVPLTAASLMTPTASARTAASVPVSAPALFTVTAQAKTSSTVSLTAASNMTATAQSTTTTTVPLTAAAALTPIAQVKTSSTAPLTVPGVQFLTPTAQATTAAGAPLTAAAQLSPAVTAMAAAVAAVTAPSATVPALLVLTMGSSTQATVIITTPFVPPPPEGRRQRIQTVFVRL